jgi:hypothetical protein
MSHATNDLIAIIRSSDKRTTEKAQSLEILIARNETETLGDIVGTELLSDQNSISWRNTLLLALEHVVVQDIELRKKLVAKLTTLGGEIKEETYPRSKHALYSLVRTLLIIIDDPMDIPRMFLFLDMGFSIKVQRITLLGFESIMSNPLPVLWENGIIKLLIDKMKIVCDCMLCEEKYLLQSEDFDLGIHALRVLIACAWDSLPSYIQDKTCLHRSWIIKHLHEALDINVVIWEKLPAGIRPSNKYTETMYDLLTSIEIGVKK